MNSSIIVLVKIFFCFFFLLNAVHYVKANQQECINNLSFTFEGLQNTTEYMKFLIACTINKTKNILDCTKRNAVFKNKLPYVHDYIDHLTKNFINFDIDISTFTLCRWLVNFEPKNILHTWLNDGDTNKINGQLYLMLEANILHALFKDDIIPSLIVAIKQNDSSYILKVLNHALKSYFQDIGEYITGDDEKNKLIKVKACKDNIMKILGIGYSSKKTIYLSKFTKKTYKFNEFNLDFYPGLYLALNTVYYVKNELLLDRKDIKTWCAELNYADGSNTDQKDITWYAVLNSAGGSNTDRNDITWYAELNSAGGSNTDRNDITWYAESYSAGGSNTGIPVDDGPHPRTYTLGHNR